MLVLDSGFSSGNRRLPSGFIAFRILVVSERYQVNVVARI
jgi:hypothetical protein